MLKRLNLTRVFVHEPRHLAPVLQNRRLAHVKVLLKLFTTLEWLLRLFMIQSRCAIGIRERWKMGGVSEPCVDTITTSHVQLLHHCAWNKMAAWRKACYICILKSWIWKRSSVYDVPKHWRSTTAPAFTSENCSQLIQCTPNRCPQNGTGKYE